MPDVEQTAQAAEETLGIIEKSLAAFSLQDAIVFACLVIGGLAVMKIILHLADRAMNRSRMEHGAWTFLHSGLKVILWLILISILLSYLGVPMTSMLAVLSVLGLALSLAVQGILSNLAGGVQVLAAKPFKVGDYIEADGAEGFVEKITLVNTKLRTRDNKMVFVPNSDMATVKIINYTEAAQRQVVMTFSTSYDSPREKVVDCINQVIEAHPLTLADPAPLVRTQAYKDSCIEYVVKVWCATEDYWDVYFDMMEQVKTAFDQAGVEITYPHLKVHMMP